MLHYVVFEVRSDTSHVKTRNFEFTLQKSWWLKSFEKLKYVKRFLFRNRHEFHRDRIATPFGKVSLMAPITNRLHAILATTL